MRTWPWLALPMLAALVCGCGDDHTRSVHLPLAVGNTWVYDVDADSLTDTAKLEVVGEEDAVYALSVQCPTGHWKGRSGLRYLSCRDSTLWIRDTVHGFWKDDVVWSSILSDLPGQGPPQTMLVYRGTGRSRLSTRPLRMVVADGDTYRNCLALHGSYVDSYFYWLIFFFGGGNDSIEVEETYCPDVGLVTFSKENHWSSWCGGLSGNGSTDSGVWHDRWQLRSYSLCGQ